MGMLPQLTLALAALHQTAQALEPASAPRHLVGRQTSNCSSVELIVARGTDEPNNSGFKLGSLVGDNLYNATKALIPDATAYGVNYPANLDCSSEPTGITDTLSHINSTLASCPNQKFALVGYSQGADIIYRAAVQLPTSQYDSIISIVQYGDPNNRGAGQLDPLGGATIGGSLPSALANRLRENCAYDDPICTNNGTVINAHLSYNLANATYIPNSAAYIQKQLQSGGQSGADDSQAVAPGNQTQGNIQALLDLGKLLGNTATTTKTCPSTTAASSASATPVVPGNGTATTTGSYGTTTPKTTSSGSGAGSTSSVTPSTGAGAVVKGGLAAVAAGVAAVMLFL
ncbi:carbohydrate esterase family 5 protein [Myriangium duriaei CBS 260.36]|uniref:Carbohydrate esterase family 5 protein n=1 Tax=Myriangium duriaei CBS 260.36 TaxID=1168546 RepID=A0A9P4IT59_9PEZI|nr:carbohydrate esterase family 5 protein [Myriangium duriaei CBS 260.36]